jgi:prepilin-type processing-associated H-X9-DG protein
VTTSPLFQVNGFNGVIVRSDLFVNPGTGAKSPPYGWYTKIDHAKIEDGSSNTLVLGEKFLDPRQYDGSAGVPGTFWHDDKGWTDGWDPDTLRATCCIPMADRQIVPAEERLHGFRFGSAHASGINSGFADGSVRSINYTVDLEVFNMLGHRSDGGVVDLGAF